ncbi:hypothetical protein HPB47_014839, partial [Ixodes persulcatus]
MQLFCLVGVSDQVLKNFGNNERRQLGGRALVVFRDTRLREAGAEVVYCLTRGAPKGPNLPRVRLNHQDALFPGHGKATHSQTWVGLSHYLLRVCGVARWLGSVVTLLTKHLAPKVQAPPAGSGSVETPLSKHLLSQDITIKKHVVHKKKEVKVKRQLLSVSAASGGCLDDVKHYVNAITSKEPGLLWCRYVGQPEPPQFQTFIQEVSSTLQGPKGSLRPLELAEASAICSATVGQRRNPSWKRERVGGITVSNFRRVVHCQQPESLVRDILYPQNVKLKPGDPRLYGIENEGKAVQQYLELMTYYDKELRVEETGLHVYPEYPSIGASPDRIGYDGEEVGVLE